MGGGALLCSAYATLGPQTDHSGSRVGGSEAASPLTPPPFPDLTRMSPPRCSRENPTLGMKGSGPRWGLCTPSRGPCPPAAPPQAQAGIWAPAVQVGTEVRPAARRRDVQPAGWAPALKPGALTLSTAPTRGANHSGQMSAGGSFNSSCVRCPHLYAGWPTDTQAVGTCSMAAPGHVGMVRMRVESRHTKAGGSRVAAG